MSNRLILCKSNKLNQNPLLYFAEGYVNLLYDLLSS